jgi:outer membrane protein insertion porin family
VRPSRGRSASVTAEFAGLGGSVKYARYRANAKQFWPVGKGFIFSLSAESGAIHSFENRGAGIEGVRLTDRFYLGEPQIRGFDIRGVGPRVVRKSYIDTNADGVLDGFSTDRETWQDDALGGKYYYLAHAELEIPLGSGAKELGLRPSIFIDAGAVFGLKTPTLTDTGPGGLFVASRDPTSGLPQFTQIDAAAPDATSGVCTASATSVVTNAVNPNPPACLGSSANAALGNTIAFKEFYLGNSPKPRVSIGIGVNWNSPFGPFRIDFAKALLTQPGDDTKSFTFNVGTQF